jgi:hypothetical protein
LASTTQSISAGYSKNFTKRPQANILYSNRLTLLKPNSEAQYREIKVEQKNQN